MAEKWIGKMHGGKGPEEGKFTAWCKRQGFSGVTRACIEIALKSKDPSVRGMAQFAKRAQKGFQDLR